MAKDPKTKKFRLPPYESPSKKWRKAIISKLNESQGDKNTYTKKDYFELEVILYFEETKVSFMDVDNRLKDVMDALQGRVGGPKSKKTKNRIIPNDNQIYKVTVEKKQSLKQNKGEGHLVIRKYKPSAKKQARG